MTTTKKSDSLLNPNPLSLQNSRTPKPKPTPVPDPESPSSQYNYPHKFVTAYGPKLSTPLTFAPGFGRTKQAFAEECDINHIMARYQRTGVLDFAQKHQGQYGDVTGLDFEVGMQAIRLAQAMFNDLPSSVRARFKNDPGEFLDFVQDDVNRAEATRLGLLKPVPKAVGEDSPPTQNATHAPLRAPDGTFREHTRAERRAEHSRPETGASERDAPPKKGG